MKALRTSIPSVHLSCWIIAWHSPMDFLQISSSALALARFSLRSSCRFCHRNMQRKSSRMHYSTNACQILSLASDEDDFFFLAKVICPSTAIDLDTNEDWNSKGLCTLPLVCKINENESTKKLLLLPHTKRYFRINRFTHFSGQCWI